MSLEIKAQDAYHCLEKGIVVPGMEPGQIVDVLPEHIAMSQALSLKRIADFLESLSLPTLHNDIIHLAWVAGQNFANGQRSAG